MFNTSTKIAVLASSSIKGVGPKYGSIGYAAAVGDMRYSSYPLNSDIIDGMMLVRNDVMFTRYGFGKERAKYEYKPLLNIFPIINKTVKIENIEQAVSKIIAKFKKEDFESGFWLDSKMHFIGKTNANVCIMAPILTLGTDLRTCSYLEFTAWFYNTLSSYAMKTTIARISGQQYLRRLPSRGSKMAATSLRRCITGRKEKSKYLSEIIGSPGARASAIGFLRLANSMAKAVPEENTRKRIRKAFRNGEYGYSKGKPSTSSKFLKAVMYDIFSDHAFKTRKQMVPAKSAASVIIARIGHTKKIFESMAHEIAKKNGEFIDRKEGPA